MAGSQGKERLEREPSLQELYVGSIKPVFREDVGQRFAAYLSRIALPDPNESEMAQVKSDIIHHSDSLPDASDSPSTTID